MGDETEGLKPWGWQDVGNGGEGDMFFLKKMYSTLRGTNIFSFEDTCPFSKVGYVSSLEGMFFFLLGDFFVVCMKQN